MYSHVWRSQRREETNKHSTFMGSRKRVKGVREGGGGVYENSYAAHVLLSVGSCAITPVAFNPFNSV